MYVRSRSCVSLWSQMGVAPPKKPTEARNKLPPYLLGEPPQDRQFQDCAWRGIGRPALHSRERLQERVGPLQRAQACLRSHCFHACNLQSN